VALAAADQPLVEWRGGEIMRTWKRSRPACLGLGLRRGTDRLTGLAGPGRFRAASRRALAHDGRSGRHSAVLVLGVNDVEDGHGTPGSGPGDLLLAEFAGLLRRCVPGPGRAFRLGGAEFAVVLGALRHPGEAYEVAGRIAAATGPVLIDGRLITLAASIGVAVSGPGELTHDELVHRAGRARERARRLGPQTRWATWRESFDQRPDDDAGPLPQAA
jgi:diguanylate cyclase (GGDEF)-like protein